MIEWDLLNWQSMIVELIIGIIGAIIITLYFRNRDEKLRRKRREIGLSSITHSVFHSLASIEALSIGFNHMVVLYEKNPVDVEITNIWNIISPSLLRFKTATKSLFHSLNAFIQDFDDKDIPFGKIIIEYNLQMLDNFAQIEATKTNEEKCILFKKIMIQYLLEYKDKLKEFTTKYNLEAYQKELLEEIELLKQQKTK